MKKSPFFPYFSFNHWLICLMASACSFLGAEPLNFTIAGESAILLNADSGAILFEKEAYASHYPASTTKIATALYALKRNKALDQEIVAEQDSLVTLSQEAKRKSNYTKPAYWLEPDGTHIGLKKGESMSLLDLMGGMLISSGNDASNVIAQAIGPTIPEFMNQMNAYLKDIGCKQTTFYNPHGLHHPQHQTTAYDLAVMTKEALKEPVFCQIIAQKKFLRPKTNKQAATTLLQTNRLIRPGPFYYSKAIGGKTGYHSKAKKTYVGVARSEGRTLIAVLLGYKERNAIFQDAIKLFDAAFNQPKVQRTFLKSGKQTFCQDLSYAACPLQTSLNEPIQWEYYPAEDPNAKCLLYWQVPELPIAKNQKVGEIHLVAQNGMLLSKSSLLALEEVPLAWPHNWIAGTVAFFNSLSWIGIGIICLMFSGTFLLICLFKQKN